MKKVHLGVIIAGAAVGLAALILTALGNPTNMGFCIACFLRDISGAVGLHSAAKVQYVRPEIIGLVLGAFIMSVASKEFKACAGSSPAIRFVLGAFVVIGALAFLGCPLRMVLRLGGGDLNALVGLIGFTGGILLGIAYMIFCYWISVKRKYPCRKTRATWKEIGHATWETLPALLLPIIIMGTITLGICTATESSAIAVIYSTIVAACKKNLSIKSFCRACIRSAKAAANVLFIIAISSAMAWAVTTLGVAQALTNFCVAYINNKIVFLLFVNVLLLLIGMLLDASPALLLMVPILWPVAKTLGIDAIHFGVMVCFNLMVGTLTPPVGMMLFIVSNVGKVKLSVMYKGILPFVAVAVVVLLLITYVPSLTTWLPGVLMP